MSDKHNSDTPWWPSCVNVDVLLLAFFTRNTFDLQRGSDTWLEPIDRWIDEWIYTFLIEKYQSDHMSYSKPQILIHINSLWYVYVTRSKGVSSVTLGTVWRVAGSQEHDKLHFCLINIKWEGKQIIKRGAEWWSKDCLWLLSENRNQLVLWLFHSTTKNGFKKIVFW